MINVTDEQKFVLKKHIKDIDKLIENDDINELLLEIDDIIVFNMDENDEPDEIGIELQKIYDQIFDNN